MCAREELLVPESGGLRPNVGGLIYWATEGRHNKTAKITVFSCMESDKKLFSKTFWSEYGFDPDNVRVIVKKASSASVAIDGRTGEFFEFKYDRFAHKDERMDRFDPLFFNIFQQKLDEIHPVLPVPAIVPTVPGVLALGYIPGTDIPIDDID